jgi:propionyl-CoA synthetase
MQSVLYEGLPIHPDGGIWWRIVEKYGVSVMFTSPTAIRVLKRQDPAYLRKYDTSSLQRLYLAGEPLAWGAQTTSLMSADTASVPEKSRKLSVLTQRSRRSQR